MKFIKLHNEINRPSYVRVDGIQMIQDDISGSRVYFVGDPAPLVVREKPIEIFKFIEEVK